jgi:beta-glucanase (GH16 family)
MLASGVGLTHRARSAHFATVAAFAALSASGVSCGGASPPSQVGPEDGGPGGTDASFSVVEASVPADAGLGGRDATSGGSDATSVDGSTGSPDGSRDGSTGSRDGSTDATSAADTTPPGDAGDDGALPGWSLTWSDEFNGADGSAADPTKWTYDVGGGGWGNSELEYYTDGPQNAVVTGGDLVITATTAGASAFTCSYGACLYTSARLKTQGLFAQAYGRFEARIQLPAGQGLWPAFWTLGDNIDTVSWPECGEMDIMEAVDKEPIQNHGTLHGPISPGAGTSYGLGATAPLTASQLSTSFHTYAIEWDPGMVRFLLDDVAYSTQTVATLHASSATGVWEFDHPFFILLNVAVGGSFPGAPDATTTFPQTMKVDWVRVYERAD